MAHSCSANSDILPGETLFCHQGMSQDTHCSDVYNNEEPEAIQVSVMEKWIILWKGMNHSYNSQHRRIFGPQH